MRAFGQLPFDHVWDLARYALFKEGGLISFSCSSAFFELLEGGGLGELHLHGVVVRWLGD
jgi:hypothetical protein